jgi:predicted membrane metal-binding protein
LDLWIRSALLLQNMFLLICVYHCVCVYVCVCVCVCVCVLLLLAKHEVYSYFASWRVVICTLGLMLTIHCCLPLRYCVLKVAVIHKRVREVKAVWRGEREKLRPPPPQGRTLSTSVRRRPISPLWRGGREEGW